jgi:hypothetical protein
LKRVLAYPRELLQRSLPPDAHRALRYSWWGGKVYLPRLIASVVRHPRPTLHCVLNSDRSAILAQLQNVNLLAPTRLCRIMTWHGSDKGRGHHNYTTVYAALFKAIRKRPLRVFELGLGTNNPDLPSNMTANGRPGASLRGWRDYFPQALVYGADVDRDILFEEDRIKTFYCDQCDETSIRRLWAQAELQSVGMDIIIEDGLHTFEANVSFLEGSLSRVRPGGFYIVEDIAGPSIGRWIDVLRNVYANRFPDCEFALITLPNPLNEDDNNLLIIHRHCSVT